MENNDVFNIICDNIDDDIEYELVYNYILKLEEGVRNLNRFIDLLKLYNIYLEKMYFDNEKI